MMNAQKTKFAALALFASLFLASPSHAGHVGIFGGPAFHSVGSYDSTDLAFGADAAFSMIPALEMGGYFTRTTNTYALTLVGVEANIYPLLTKVFYVGAKLGNANAGGNNWVSYAPAVGFNIDLAATASFGVDATYYLYSGSTGKLLALLANIKLWF